MTTGRHLRCSFCGKSKDAVRKFISGPSVYICNECIALCNEILAEDEEREVAEAITQVPTPMNDTVDPAIVQTVLADASMVNVTASPDVAVAGTSYVDATAGNGIPYWYVVRARNNESCSGAGLTESNLAPPERSGGSRRARARGQTDRSSFAFA